MSKRKIGCHYSKSNAHHKHVPNRAQITHALSCCLPELQPKRWVTGHVSVALMATVVTPWPHPSMTLAASIERLRIASTAPHAFYATICGSGSRSLAMGFRRSNGFCCFDCTSGTGVPSKN